MPQQQSLELLFEVIMTNDTTYEQAIIQVKVIRSKGHVSLVEWNDSGRFRRVIVPRDVVFEGDNKVTYVDENSLEMGIPYGVSWESRLKKTFQISNTQIAEQLEVSGIWTKEDYNNNPSVVHQAVLGAAREILSELYSIVHSIPSQEE